MTARSITDSILNCEIATSLAILSDRCMHAQRRQGVVYTLNSFQLFNQSSASKYPPHLPPALPNSLSRRTVTQTRTHGHTSPLQINMHLLIRLERFGTFFYGRMISLLLASLIIIFLGVLLTCYSLLEPPLACPIYSISTCPI